MILTENWDLMKPELGENDKAVDWSVNLDRIDGALLSPAQKTGLVGGADTALHRHATASPSASQNADATSAEGASANYVRADHQHTFNMASATGDISPVTAGGTSSIGSGSKFVRANHQHAASVAAPVALSVGGANTVGSATTFCRSDHKHSLPAFGTASGTFCQGNDARLLTSAQKTGLTGGSATTLHKHDVDGADIKTGKISVDRLPVGIGSDNVMRLASRGFTGTNNTTVWTEYTASSGWRRFRTASSTYPFAMQIGTFLNGVFVHLWGCMQATTESGNGWYWGLGIHDGASTRHSFLQSPMLTGTLGDGTQLSQWIHDSTNNHDPKVLDLWVRTPASDKVTILGQDASSGMYRSLLGYTAFY